MSAPTKLARQGLHSFLAIASTSLAGILTTALIARHLGPAGMGYYTMIVWISAMVGMIANLGYVTTTMKAMAEAQGRQDGQECAGVLAFANHRVWRWGLVATLGMGGLAPFIARASGHADLVSALLVGSLGIIPGALFALYQAACQALERYDQVAWVTSLCYGAIVLGVCGVLLTHGSLAALVGVTSACLAVGACAYFLLLSTWYGGWWRVAIPAEKSRELRQYQVPVFVMLVLDAIVWQRSEIFFLGTFALPSDVAFYGMAFSLASMAMRLLPGTLIGLLIPKMSRAVGSGDNGSLGGMFTQSCRYMAMLAIPVAVGGAILARPIVHLLYGPEYDSVAGLMSALLAANALVMIYGFPTSSILYSANGQNALVRIGLAISALNLLLAWILIPPYGAWGAVGANAIAQLASLLPGLIAAKRHTGAKAPVRIVGQYLAAAGLMGIPLWGLVQVAPPLVSLLVSPFLGVGLFGILMYKLGLLTSEDHMVLRAIAQRLAALRLVRRLLPSQDR